MVICLFEINFLVSVHVVPDRSNTYAAPALDTPPGSEFLVPAITISPEIDKEPNIVSSSFACPSLAISLASWVHVVPSLLNMYTAPAPVAFVASYCAPTAI